MLPIFPRPLSGLRRLGRQTWQATDNDPQFTIGLGFWRPRFLSIRLEGLDGPLDPVVYFDSGQGYSEGESRPLQTAERIACVIALGRLPKLRRIRFDPAAQPAKFRLSIVGTRRLWRARKSAKRFFDAGGSPSAATFELIDDREWRVAGHIDGSPARLSSVEHHFRHVVSLAAQLPASPRGRGAAPLISLIVPTYNSPPRHLDELLASVRDQGDAGAELIFSDDGSSSEETLVWFDRHRGEPDLTIVENRLNRGTAAATNAGLAVARGAWVSLVDHDDALAPFALKMFARAIAARPEAAFVYTDEVIANRDLRPIDYFMKPAFDPVLLSGVNYINHLSFFRRDRLMALGGLESGLQGSQDYDLLLRYLDGLNAREIVHIPYPAYLWRRHDAAYSTMSRAVATDSARRALARYHRRHDGAGPTVIPALLPDLHRVAFERTDWPLVSIVIPNRDAYRLIAALLDGLADRTDYPALEIVIVDNGSTDARVLALYERCKSRFRAFRCQLVTEAFNFSRAVNRGIAMASGAFILLLNNDIEIVESGWLKEMVTCFAYSGTGIVGARLLYPDRRIQHAGVIVGLGGLAGHWFINEAENHAGPMGRLAVRQTMSAVTGAAMLISRVCLDATGVFDEDLFGVAYNDVDFCLRAKACGFRTVWTPFATLIHHESASRGSDERPETIARFRREQENLRRRHGTLSYQDDAFNPWYSRDRSRPIYRYLATLPDCR